MEKADADTEAETSADAGDESGSDDASSGETQNVLAARLGVPDTYTAVASTSDGSFTLTCDATVEVPDAAQVPVYSVSQKAFTQDFIDLVTETFFGDSPVYDWDYYYQTTKAEALEKLNELKEYQAEGNTDPYGYIEAARESGAFEDIGLIRQNRACRLIHILHLRLHQCCKCVGIMSGCLFGQFG